MELVFVALVGLAIAVVIGSVRVCCSPRPPPKENPMVNDILVSLLGIQARSYDTLQEINQKLYALQQQQEHKNDETLMHFYAPKQDDEEFDSVRSRPRKEPVE